MDIEVLRREGNAIRLLVRGVKLHVLNSIRRAILAEVPTMAVDYVVFMENSSVFYDEYIAHRLGLIPLTSENALGKYKPPEECREAGEKGVFSEDCFVKLELSGEGTPGGVKTLYAGDLVTGDPDVRPVYEKIPIVQLLENQRIKLEAYARLGRGREHIKWSPASVASHKYIAKINIDREKCRYPGCKKCVEICPKQVIVEKDGTVEVEEARLMDCSLCRLCETVCPSEAINVSYKEDEYILYFESTGSLTPKRILIEATRALEDKLNELKKSLVEGVPYGAS
ncbi:DNA-directed RNA polymerase subunit D [Thermogladius calderae 1633]|uniref:DNA-directed RNA polymerase subunit Rpo3 n=1 Tax=Thermogladius calderae (strain DSM 22663 / VKM B-2946 / 1633) TaxID=1184251 RepID=I3TDW7_THEC1|nr:DNA-directed RNA polymerase subunit D [Thermogladius calderae]AFK50955.1 DNA-directed RNA polymerase subunit D [Thermogladius calderae 1633]